MKIQQIHSPELGRSIGNFSQAIKVTDATSLLFVSGLTSRDRDGNVVGAGDIRLQTETVLENLKAVVAEAGATLQDVVKVTVFVRDIEMFDDIHEVRARYFAEPYPASSMIEISRMVSPDHLIEVEAIVAI